MSLLYALFSTTMAKIKSESQALWLFRRYQVICKFEKSPPLPPPLSPFCYLYDFVSFWVKKRCFSTCCLRKGAAGGCCSGRGCCSCCFDHPLSKAKTGHADTQHEAFFWSQTRQAYLAVRTDKERRKEEKDKFLNGLSDTVSANMLLSRTMNCGSASALKDALATQKTVGALEALLREKEAENHQLKERILGLTDEVERLERYVKAADASES